MVHQPGSSNKPNAAKYWTYLKDQYFRIPQKHADKSKLGKLAVGHEPCNF